MTQRPAPASALPTAARILVTGSSGFIGTNLVEYCLDQGRPVLGLDLKPPRNPAHRTVHRALDLMDPSAIDAAFAEFQPTHVVHLGARTDLLGTTAADYAVNTTGLEQLVAAQRRYPVPHAALYASSRLVNRIGYTPRDAADLNPTTAYGHSKAAGERFLLQDPTPVPAHVRWAIIRPTSIWGPWFDIPYRVFFDSVLAGRYVHPAGRRVRKSFGYVGNVVHQIDRLLAGIDRAQGQVLYVADYEPIEVHAFANRIRTAHGLGPVREIPWPVLRAGALLGDLGQKLGMQHPPLTSFRLDNLVTEMLYDLMPTRGLVGSTPYTNDDGIQRTLAWLDGPGRRVNPGTRSPGSPSAHPGAG